MGIDPETEPWLAHNVRRATRTWGEHVERRLEESDLEPYSPPKQPMRPVPRYTTLAEVLMLSTATSEWGSEADLPQPTGADVGALLEGLRGSRPVA